MGKRLYVGNLAYGIRDADLKRLFQTFGFVESAQVAVDRATGRSKGFGFVEMDSDLAAQFAVAGLHGKEVDGRALTVNVAQPKPEEHGPRRPAPPPRPRRRAPALGRKLRKPPPGKDAGEA